jgi:hypothetical protein
MNIYAVTISGRKYLFSGNLSPSIISYIDDYCDNLSVKKVSSEPLKIYMSLIDSIRHKFGTNIELIEIEHIFRINL